MAGNIRSLNDLRAWYGAAGAGMSDEEMLTGFAKAAGMDHVQLANQLGYDPGTGSMNRERMSSSVDSYQGNLYGLGEAAAGALGAPGVRDWMANQRRRNEFQSEVASARARSAGAVDRWADVHGPGDFANYASGLAIESLPYMGEAAVGALTGGSSAVAAGLSRGAVTAARVAGAGLASYPSAVGDILQNQREQSGSMDLPSAAVLAVPYAALNAGMGVEGAIARRGLVRNSVRALDEMQGARGALARTGASMARTGAEEAASETGQEALNQLGRMAVDPNEQFMSPAAQDRFKESAIGGGVLGGMFGGIGGHRRSAEYRPNPVDQPGGADLLNAPAAPPLQLGYDPTAGQAPYYAFPDGSAALTSEAAEIERQRRALAQYAPQEARPDFALDGSSAALAPHDDVAHAIGGNQNLDQYELFEPGGQPTYAADPSFGYQRVPGEVEFTPTEAPDLGFAEYQPRQPGLEFRPEIDTRGMSLAPLQEQRQYDFLAGEFQPTEAGQGDRPGLELHPQQDYLTRTDGQLALPLQERTEAPALTGAPLTETLRANQRGYMNELPFTPPEAKITTPVGRKLWTMADSLHSEGFIDDATMDQVNTMLTTSKVGGASKIINQALADRAAAKAAIEKEQQQVQREQEKALAQAQKQEEKQAQAEGKAQQEYVAAKVDRWERLLECLRA